MAMTLTEGKIAGLRAVSNERGVIAAAALDQRGVLKKMLAKEMNGEVPSDVMVMGVRRNEHRAPLRRSSFRGVPLPDPAHKPQSHAKRFEAVIG